MSAEPELTPVEHGDELYPVPIIDGGSNQIVCVFGRKGSGKTELAQTLYRWWPGVDRICIDPNGHARPGADAKTIRGSNPPTSMPAREHEDVPVNLHYIADPRSPTFFDDLDRAIGAALVPQDRRTVLWVDEIGRVSRVNKTPPNLSTLLMQSRHYHASAILAGPRPVNIDRLCLQQADRIYVFHLPNPEDRARIAKEAGVDPDVMEEAHSEIARRDRKFWHLVIIVGEDEPYLCPPLPADWRTDPAEAT